MAKFQSFLENAKIKLSTCLTCYVEVNNIDIDDNFGHLTIKINFFYFAV